MSDTFTYADFLDWLGYAASVVLIVAMMMRSITRLRWVNAAGAFIFAIYGFLIGAAPVAALNAALTLVNLAQLWLLRRSPEGFRIIRPDLRGEYARLFVDVNSRDIQRFQPGFRFDPDRFNLGVFVLLDLEVVGVVMGRIDEQGTLDVALDFVTPRYRNMKVGRFLFVENKQYFKDRGVERIVASGRSKAHSEYLRGVGFLAAPSADDPRRYELAL